MAPESIAKLNALGFEWQLRYKYPTALDQVLKDVAKKQDAWGERGRKAPLSIFF